MRNTSTRSVPEKGAVSNGAIYIGLGSNIDKPYLQIRNAIVALDKLPETKVIQDSGYYSSKPMGPEDQPDYVNAVVELVTVLTAHDLLTECQLIEQHQRRIKTRRWGERSIDLDVLLYADQRINTRDLTVPHPGICQRDFVYMPLLKLNPDLEIPGRGMLNTIVKSASDETTGFACHFVGNIE